MDNRPIGIFDSGLGGLTCYRELARLLPGEDTVFFGDTAQMPYGGRDPETLRRFARGNIAFLLGQGVKAILIACGTISSVCADLPEEISGVPVLRLIRPTAAAAAVTGNGKIALIATEATVRSGAIEAEIKRHLPGCTVTALACPALVPAIEAGHTDPDDPLVERLLAEYLAPVRQSGADTLVLGCTHYPLLARAIAVRLPEVALVDSGAALAEAAQTLLVKRSLLSGQAQGTHRFFVSGDVDSFADNARRFLGRDISAETAHIDPADIDAAGAKGELF